MNVGQLPKSHQAPITQRSAPTPERKKAAEAHTKSNDQFVSRSENFGVLSSIGNVLSGTAVTVAATGTSASLLVAALPAAITTTTGLMIAGAGLVAGVAAHYGFKTLGKVLHNKFLKPQTEQMQTDRETYRDSLLNELNDEGVRKATDETWQLNLQVEQNKETAADGRALLTMELINLESLADGRLRSGWQGDLARSLDDPTDFVQIRNSINSTDDPAATYKQMKGSAS